MLWKNESPLFMRLDRTGMSEMFREEGAKKVLRPMSWGEISQLKGQAIPFDFTSWRVKVR